MKYFLGILLLGALIIVYGYGKTSYNGQIIHNIDKWHASISVSDKYTFIMKDAYAVLKDSAKEKDAFIHTLNKKFYNKNNFTEIVSTHAKNVFSGAGHGSYYEGDSIVQWEKYYNNKNTLVHKLFVNYISYISNVPNDTTQAKGFAPIWTIAKRETLGPLYYIQFPEKYITESENIYAFNINGDSIIINDILDDFEIK